MSPMSRFGFAVLVALSVTGAGATPVQGCSARKARASGKAVARVLGCHARAKSHLAAVAARCVERADDGLVRRVTRLGDTACPGDAVTVRALVDACVAALLPDLPGDGACPAASTKAVGNAVRGVLSCAASDVAGRDGDQACVAQSDAALSEALANAGGCAAASTGADVHAACTDALIAALTAVTTTTSTTATTSSSSTTSTTTTPTGTRCCRRTVTCGPFDTCELAGSEEECSDTGGIPTGPGTCTEPDPCASATTTTPPSACCVASIPGGPRDQCLVLGLCECVVADGRFVPFTMCTPGVCTAPGT